MCVRASPRSLSTLHKELIMYRKRPMPPPGITDEMIRNLWNAVPKVTQLVVIDLDHDFVPKILPNGKISFESIKNQPNIPERE